MPVNIRVGSPSLLNNYDLLKKSSACFAQTKLSALNAYIMSTAMIAFILQVSLGHDKNDYQQFR